MALNGSSHLPATLPEASPDRLPAAYDDAVKAITACESTVRCRQWADEAATMVHYAKIRDDRTLHNHALQIQLWAERRWGELDRKLHPDRRRDNLVQNQPTHRNEVHLNSVNEGGTARNEEDLTSVNGRRSMPDDGTSEYQRRVARRLADIPAAEFRRQVESDSPPSKSQLAGLAKRTVVSDNTDAAVNPHDGLSAFAAFCERTDPVAMASGVNLEELDSVRALVTTAERWLERFVDGLPSANW